MTSLLKRLAWIPCCAVLASSLFAADWPQWRGPNRDGKALEKGLKLDWSKGEPKHLWPIGGVGGGYASLAVVNQRIYTTGNLEAGQGVTCLDAKTGDLIWSTPVTEIVPKHGYEGSRCTPTIDGDSLYIVTSDGQIACLKSADGEVVWRRSFKDFGGKMMSVWGFSESPLVDGDLVLCTPGGPEAMIVALKKSSGEEVWRSAVPELGEAGKDGAGYSSIVISNGAGVKQYVTLVGRGVVSVRAADGKFLWGYNPVANGTANIPTPLPLGDFIFASSGYGTGAALLELKADGNGGVKAVEKYFLDAKTFQNHHGGMIVDGEFIYAGHQHNKGFPICLHWPSGEVKWTDDPRERKWDGSAAVTYVNGQMLFRYENGVLALVAATPEGFKFTGAFTPVYQEGKSWSHPVVVGDKLYLREQNKLMCYQL
ncbi:MAG: PQQ-like beta-propeller repeat protein [Planctomycetaceae bacterium]|nr:PQQ-like beta-propeller repeat protein [Planctomycetaceae bacterium]